MARPIQSDLFATLPGAEPRAAEALPPYRPDLDKVRARPQRILGELRAAGTMPWDRERLSLFRTIFPEMTGWLPTEEGQQLRAAFAAELGRLDAA
jgi:hypothetical protein